VTCDSRGGEFLIRNTSEEKKEKERSLSYRGKPSLGEKSSSTFEVPKQLLLAKPSFNGKEKKMCIGKGVQQRKTLLIEKRGDV